MEPCPGFPPPGESRVASSRRPIPCFISHLYRLEQRLPLQLQKAKMKLCSCFCAELYNFFSPGNRFKSPFLPLSLFFLPLGTAWGMRTKLCVCVPPLPGFCAGCAGTHSLTPSLHLRQGCIMNPEKKPHKYLDAPSTYPTGVKKQRL